MRQEKSYVDNFVFSPNLTMWLMSPWPLCQNRHDIVAEELTFAAEEGGDHLVDRNPDADDGKYDNFYQYEVRTN